MAVSPNMMMKKTKSLKEIKMERKIKNLFDNDPLFQMRKSIDKSTSQSILNHNLILSK